MEVSLNNVIIYRNVCKRQVKEGFAEKLSA
jgi:hypothetical protein